MDKESDKKCIVEFTFKNTTGNDYSLKYDIMKLIKVSSFIDSMVNGQFDIENTVDLSFCDKIIFICYTELILSSKFILDLSDSSKVQDHFFQLWKLFDYMGSSISDDITHNYVIGSDEHLLYLLFLDLIIPIELKTNSFIPYILDIDNPERLKIIEEKQDKTNLKNYDAYELQQHYKKIKKKTIYETKIMEYLNFNEDVKHIRDTFYFYIDEIFTEISNELTFSRLFISQFLHKIDKILKSSYNYNKYKHTGVFTDRLKKMIGSEWKWVEESYDKNTDTFIFPDGLVLAGGALFTCVSDRNMNEITDSEDLDFWIYGDTPEDCRINLLNALKFFGCSQYDISPSGDISTNKVYYSVDRSVITLIIPGITSRNIQIIYGEEFSPSMYTDKFDSGYIRSYYDGKNVYVSDECRLALNYNIVDIHIQYIQKRRLFKYLRYDFVDLQNNLIWLKIDNIVSKRVIKIPLSNKLELINKLCNTNKYVQKSLSKFVRLSDTNNDIINKVIIVSRLCGLHDVNSNLLHVYTNIKELIKCEVIPKFDMNDEYFIRDDDIINDENMIDTEDIFKQLTIKLSDHQSIINHNLNKIKDIELIPGLVPYDNHYIKSRFVLHEDVFIVFKDIEVRKSETSNHIYAFIDEKTNGKFIKIAGKINTVLCDIFNNTVYDKFNKKSYYNKEDIGDVGLFKTNENGYVISLYYHKNLVYMKSGKDVEITDIMRVNLSIKLSGWNKFNNDTYGTLKLANNIKILDM